MPSTPSAGISILRKEPFSEPEPFGIISIRTCRGASSKSMLMTGISRPHELCSFTRVIGCTTEERSGCSRVARSTPRRIASFERDAVDPHVAPDRDVVDRDAGVLAKQVAGALGDRDVLDHGAEDRLRGRVVLVAGEAVEAALDLRRQDLERPDVELLRDAPRSPHSRARRGRRRRAWLMLRGSGGRGGRRRGRARKRRRWRGSASRASRRTR